MAGFEVITYGRFWVIAEGRPRALCLFGIELAPFLDSVSE
jgi:hypothetical protein